jgi:hypothetical protein
MKIARQKCWVSWLLNAAERGCRNGRKVAKCGESSAFGFYIAPSKLNAPELPVEQAGL